jgi:tetratricopeptide (TPR) repeat protein
VWVSTAPRLVHFRTDEPEAEVDERSALATLCEMGTSAKLAGHRPAVLHVTDERLAAALAEALAGCDTSVEIVPELPALNTCIDLLAEGVGQDNTPGALDAPGVTIERLRAFADAAAHFFRAAPWRYLDDGDLVRVEAPKAGKGLSLFAVMGSAGQQFGLGFFASVKRYRDMMAGASPEELFKEGSEWAVYFSPPWETPAHDLLAWDRYELPLASPTAYPAAIRLDVHRDPLRPDAGRLAYFEGLLRALAATSEAEMDSGRWSHEVQTADGPATYVLTLPDLLEPTKEDELQTTDWTPLERAQDLIYEAFEIRGRRQIQLIRRALELSPDCADAYLLLAKRSSSPDERLPLYEQAVAAGERALGPGALADPGRAFLGEITTLPYMRARSGLADCLRDLGRIDDAVGHMQALLQLNPGDDLGVRYRLLGALLEANRNADAEALLEDYDEPSATWAYASVLLALRAKDRRLARSRLRGALRANRHVPRYLTGQRDLPDEMPTAYRIGDQDEAAICAFDLLPAWTQTADASVWLRAETRKKK